MIMFASDKTFSNEGGQMEQLIRTKGRGGFRRLRIGAPALILLISTASGNAAFSSERNRTDAHSVSEEASLLRASVGLKPPTPSQLRAADLNGDRRITLPELFLALQRPVPSCRDESGEIASGWGILTAPGDGYQDYSVHEIDASCFKEGDLLRIEVTVGSGFSGASFDLFGEDQTIPRAGRPVSLAGAYDLQPGITTTLTYHLTRGQVFRFGADGNWYSPKGTQNTYRFVASVKRMNG
jgi:hypothetical protein